MSFSLVFVTLKSVNSYIYSGSWLTETLEILLPVRWAALSQMISGGLMKESCTSAPPLMEVGALRVGQDTNSSVGHFWTNEPKWNTGAHHSLKQFKDQVQTTNVNYIFITILWALSCCMFSFNLSTFSCFIFYRKLVRFVWPYNLSAAIKPRAQSNRA